MCCYNSLLEDLITSVRLPWEWTLRSLQLASLCLFSLLILFCILAQSLNHVQSFVTPCTAAYQAPLSMGIPRQEYWSGLPLPPPEDLPDRGIKPTSVASPAIACGFFTTLTLFTTSVTWEAPYTVINHTMKMTIFWVFEFSYCQVISVVSDSVWPHRRQPTRLPPPWDSPGKNTGVGCHFLLQCMKVKSEREVAQSCLTLSDPRDCSPLIGLHLLSSLVKNCFTLPSGIQGRSWRLEFVP